MKTFLLEMPCTWVARAPRWGWLPMLGRRVVAGLSPPDALSRQEEKKRYGAGRTDGAGNPPGAAGRAAEGINGVRASRTVGDKAT